MITELASATIISLLISDWYSWRHYKSARRYENNYKKIGSLFFFLGILLGAFVLLSNWSTEFLFLCIMLMLVMGYLDNAGDEKAVQRFLDDLEQNPEDSGSDAYQLISVCTDDSIDNSLKQKSLDTLEDHKILLENNNVGIDVKLPDVVDLLNAGSEEVRSIGARLLKIISEVSPNELKHEKEVFKEHLDDGNENVRINMGVVVENICHNDEAIGCGTNPDQDLCDECGEPVEESNKYCMNCGTEILA